MSEHARTALCLLRTPCTCCCGLALLHGSVLKTPPDAVLLSEHEARTYTDQLQGGRWTRCQFLGKICFVGTWEVLPTELPDDPCCGGSQQYTGYSKVFVEESRMTFSGGRQGRMETQTLQLHRSPAGELYLDREAGSNSIQSDPFKDQNGIFWIRLENHMIWLDECRP